MTDPEFPVPRGFEGRIAFWRHIFTKYGKDHRVFHHRAEPAIIYSVLDFSAINAKYHGSAQQRARENAADAEIAKIQKALRHLASGAAARNDFERRIVQLFQTYLEASPRAFREASDPKLIRYQRGIKELFRDGLVRSGRYLYAIEHIFEVEGLPAGLGRLPLVESSFDYTAYSSVGAAGIWQFMRATGKRFMRIDASIDERRDPILATRSAARYLSNAYNQLQSWPLAITSYNHGLAGVKRAVNQTGSRDLSVIVKKYDGKTFGFASGNFYAEFLAALEVERNANFYFPGLVREQPWYFDEVRLNQSVRFSDLAQKAGTSSEELARLNLSYRDPVLKGRVLVPRGSVVKLPKGAKDRLLAKLPGSQAIELGMPAAQAKSDLNAASRGASQVVAAQRTGTSTASAATYRVQSGDTAGAIAKRYRVSTQQLLSHNNISDPRRLRVGMTLSIPGTNAGVESRSERSAETTRNVETSTSSAEAGSRAHTVVSGETLSEIAKKYAVSLEALQRENGLSKKSVIRIGQKVRIPSGGGKQPKSAPAVRTARTHTVQSGDTLSSIAKQHGLSLSRLKQLNPGSKTLIKPGQILVVE